MKVHLAVLNPDGVKFDLSVKLLKSLWNRLGDSIVHQELPGLAKMFRPGENFTLGFIISAREKKHAVEVKGPTLFKRDKTVDFVIHIPYRQFTTFAETAEYVLDAMSQGVSSVVEKYEGDSNKIKESIQDLLEKVRAGPERFQ